MLDFSPFGIFLKLAMIPGILIALTLHEISHGLVAYRLGDRTAKSQGRLSLNPLRHLDPIGTLFLLFVGFGWAKPVPVNPYALTKKPKTGMAWVAAAGPLSNFCMALLGGIIMLAYIHFVGDSWLYRVDFTAETYFGFAIYLFIYINFVLMIFNLIPIPPLDGSRIVAVFLSPDLRYRYDRIEQFGMIIIFALCIIPLGGRTIISWILTTPVQALTNMVLSLAGITVY